MSEIHKQTLWTPDMLLIHQKHPLWDDAKGDQMEQSSKQAVIESMLLQLPGNHLKLDREHKGLRGIHSTVSLVLHVE